MNKNRFKDKVVVVTGGASGLGKAAAERFSAEGALVVITDVQAELGESLAKQLGARFQAHDVSIESHWQQLMARVESELGRLDVVFNNAGIVGLSQSIDNLEMDNWQRMIAVNQTGVMLGCKYGVELMRRNPGSSSGVIINTASTASFRALAGNLAYCTTKSAVSAITRSVALWCARNHLNIRCNSIHPGAIETPIHDHLLVTQQNPAPILQALNNMSPLGRMGTAVEVANLVAFLASEEASYITGAEYLIDGGALVAHPGR